MKTSRLRLAAGVAVLLFMAALGIRLVPPYVQNWKLQRFLNELMADPATANRPPSEVAAVISTQAGVLGLPVQPADVQVTRLESSFKIEVLYIVHIDLPGYTVDLHFRPVAGGT